MVSWHELIHLDDKLRALTRDEFYALTPANWSSNGVTGGPDTIYGVRIGRTLPAAWTLDEKWPWVATLPACWHDWRYSQGGSEELRLAVDLTFSAWCARLVEEGVWWPLLPLARRRVLTQHRVVRSWLGAAKWTR